MAETPIDEENKNLVEVKQHKSLKTAASVDETILPRRFDKKPSLFKTDQS